MTNTEIANMIDHTILKATATLEDVEKLCQEAEMIEEQ
jgi:deoxyribose-phosphate aldolase